MLLLRARGDEPGHPVPDLEADGEVGALRVRVGDFQGGPARRVYSITDAGETYLEFWAESLKQYQRNMDAFFRLYTGRPVTSDQQEDDR